MKSVWHDIWGSAQGGIATFAPQTRILAGTAVFAVCVLAPADASPGVALSSFCLLFWFLLCRPKAKIVQSMTLFGLAMFAPYFLLSPLIASDTTSLAQSMIVPWRVFFRGMLTLLICITTISTLTLSELRAGISNLPVPVIVREIILQIVHQTISMTYETRRIAQAMAVRGVSGKIRTAIKVLTTLPQVWLPRVIGRAENIAAAMEVRGYSDVNLAEIDSPGLRPRDVLLLFFTGVLLTMSFLIRFGWTK